MGCRLIVVTSATLRGGRNDGELHVTGSLIRNKFSELSEVFESWPILAIGMFNNGKAWIGIGAGGCLSECNGDTGLGVILVRRLCFVVNDVSALFDGTASFFSLTGGGGIMPCFGSIFIETGREIAMSFVGCSLDGDGAGALRFTTFVGPVRTGVVGIGLVSIGDEAWDFGSSFGSSLDFNDFGRSVDLLDSVLVI